MILYFVIMFLCAVLFLAVGIAIYRGKTDLIHDYHQTNVKESERREYGRAFSKGMFVLSASMFASGILVLFGDNGAVQTASLIVLFAGIAVSVVIFLIVQKKYNGGLFG